MPKKYLSYNEQKQIWRIIISPENRLIIESRDISSKEVYFSCIDLNTGDPIWKEIQLEEKFWIGIEAVYKNFIIFHKFAKPDMPGHRGVIVFDIISKQVIWENPGLLFLFAYEDKIYCYKSKFEGKNYFLLDLYSGNQIEDLGRDQAKIEHAAGLAKEEENTGRYLFPERYFPNIKLNSNVKILIDSEFINSNITGNLEFLIYKDLLMLNYHTSNSGTLYDNNFLIYDIPGAKVIHKESIDKKIEKLMPESFFIYNDLLILLKNKIEVEIWKLD